MKDLTREEKRVRDQAVTGLLKSHTKQMLATLYHDVRRYRAADRGTADRELREAKSLFTQLQDRFLAAERQIEQQALGITALEKARDRLLNAIEDAHEAGVDHRAADDRLRGANGILDTLHAEISQDRHAHTTGGFTACDEAAPTMAQVPRVFR